MKKSIYLILSTISIAIIAWLLFGNKNIKSVESNISKISNNTEDNNIKQKNSIEQEITLDSTPITSKVNTYPKIVKKSHINIKKQIAYQKYRENYNKMQQIRMNQYLSHQAKLQYTREGGTRSKLEAVKRDKEREFRQRHQSSMMPQRERSRANFLRHSREMQKRKEQMQMLQKQQEMQQKYKGE